MWEVFLYESRAEECEERLLSDLAIQLSSQLVNEEVLGYRHLDLAQPLETSGLVESLVEPGCIEEVVVAGASTLVLGFLLAVALVLAAPAAALAVALSGRHPVQSCYTDKVSCIIL